MRPMNEMVSDKWDRMDIRGVRWLLFTPGMYDEMRTATDEQLIDYAASQGGESDEDSVFVSRVECAKVGDWLAFKDGIAIRIGNRISSD